MSPRQVLEFASTHSVRQIDLRFSDIGALQHHVSYPIAELTEASFQDGFGIDGSGMRGWAALGETDLLLIPDPATAFLDPFSEVPSLALACDVLDPITYRSSSLDPRGIAKNAELYLKNTGVADVACFGAAAEFFVFDNIRFDQNEYCSFYFIDAGESDHRKDLCTVIVETMLQCGLNVEFHREVSRQGQCEIGLSEAPLVESADHVLLFKYLAANVATRRGQTVTFMPKPLFSENGSGMRTRQSLRKGGLPLFAGPPLLHYIGGLLKHARALAAIVAPTTNSYKRLALEDGAPVRIAYSCRDSAAACRIPDHGRVEFRPPDASSNPYLAFAAMLMAGLDGVINQIDPGEPLEELKNVAPLPASLEDALACLEDDLDFLTKSDVFSEDLLDTFIEDKRRNESDAIRLRPHPYEFALYYDV